MLSNRIVNRRLSNEKYFGDRIAPDGDNPENPDPLLVDIRAQGSSFTLPFPLPFFPVRMMLLKHAPPYPNSKLPRKRPHRPPLLRHRGTQRRRPQDPELRPGKPPPAPDRTRGVWPPGIEDNGDRAAGCFLRDPGRGGRVGGLGALVGEGVLGSLMAGG